jgi:hypothetical protein
MTTASLKMRRSLFRAEEPEWLVWLLVAVLLAIGLIARTIVLSRTTAYTGANVSVSYPAAWIALAKQGEDELLNVGEPFETGLFPARFSLLQMPVTSISTKAQSLGDFALKWSDRGAQDLLAYRVLNIEPVKVRGQDAVRVDYVYVADPALATANSIPVVARGADFLIRQGDTMTVARLLAASDTFDGLGQTWDRITGSLELR